VDSGNRETLHSLGSDTYLQNEGKSRKKIMGTIKKIKIAGLSSVAALLMTPALSMAETTQGDVTIGTGGHSLVHRVSHSLAGSKNYTRGNTAGYKWDQNAQRPESSAEWSENSAPRSGYKWGERATTKPTEQSYAGTSSYQWGSMSYADQSAFRWGVRSYADQSAFRWGVRSYADQSAFRWGVRSDSDQSAFRWGVRSYADQSAFRWGVRSDSDQSAFRWGVRSYAEQSAFRWGVRSQSDQNAFRWGVR
jgi:hypothetical protein